MIGLTTSNTCCDDCLVAIFGESDEYFLFNTSISLSNSSVISPLTAWRNFIFLLSSRSESLFSQSFLLHVFFRPTSLHASLIFVGTENGSLLQLKFSFIFLISSLPRGAPWADDVPAFEGDPNPIIVLQAISDGEFVFNSSFIASSISWWLCPLISLVLQPEASNLFNWSVESDKSNDPSIEISLLSYKTTKFDKPKCPARPIASWLIPSIKSPSDAIT